MIALQKQQAASADADSSSTSSSASSAPWLWKRNIVPSGEFRPSIGEYHLPSASDLAANTHLRDSSIPWRTGNGASQNAPCKEGSDQGAKCYQGMQDRTQSDCMTVRLASNSKALHTKQPPMKSPSGAHEEGTSTSTQEPTTDSDVPTDPINSSGTSVQTVEDNCAAQPHLEPATTQCLSPNSVTRRADFFEGLINATTPTYITVSPFGNYPSAAPCIAMTRDIPILHPFHRGLAHVGSDHVYVYLSVCQINWYPAMYSTASATAMAEHLCLCTVSAPPPDLSCIRCNLRAEGWSASWILLMQCQDAMQMAPCIHFRKLCVL